MAIQTPTGEEKEFGCAVCGGSNVRPVETVWLACEVCLHILFCVANGMDPMQLGATPEECAIVQQAMG